MAGAKRRYTVPELLDYLDDNFDIPNDGVNSDIGGLDEDFDEENDLLPEVAVSEDEDDEDVHLAALDIEENGDQDSSRGRPSNVSLNDFEWSSVRSDIDIPSFSQAVGPANVMPTESLAVDVFQLFVDNRMLGNIIRETNRYACQLLQARNKDVRSWKEVSLEELKAFLGLLIAMSIHRLPSLRDYWSSDWVLGVPEFAKVMPRNRFLEIWNNLHLCDNSKMPQHGEPNFDKLFKVREFLNDLNTNFRINYNPHREQAVDEAMIKYKGRTSLKQYMPMKPIKRGIKMWCRADSTNGYLCEFDIYTGKSPQGVQHGLGYSAVTKLLYLNKILCCGTFQSGQKEFPACLYDKAAIKRMKRGDVVWRMKGPVLALTWMDKKAVHATGTYTQAPAQQLPEVNRKQQNGTIEKIPCPELVSSYNTYMGGVDKNDQMKSYYPIPEAGKKWWSRVFYDLMDRSIHNSFVLEQESTHHAKRSQKLFRNDLAKQLIGNFSSRRKHGRPSDEHLLARHVERHFPDFLPTNVKGKTLERRCKVCYDGGRVKRTSYYCPDCDVGLWLHLAFDFTISHRLYYVKRNTGNVSNVYIPVFLYFTLIIFYRISTFWFCWVA